MPHIHEVADQDMHFLIDPETRKISNETNTKVKLVQFDHNSKAITFEMPRIVEGHDMAECDEIMVHYVNISKNRKNKKDGNFKVKDKRLSEDEQNIIFSWDIYRNATEIAGTLNFLICFYCISDEIDYVWNTEICKDISISEGMDNSKEVAEKYPDIILQLMQTIEMADDVQLHADQAVSAKNIAIENANISTNNAEETEADRVETENSKNIAGVYMQQAIEASEKSEEALNQFLSTLSAQPKRYYRLSVAEMQTIENPHEDDLCYVVDLQNSRTAIYFYDSDDIDGDKVNPEWQFLGNAEFAQMDKLTLLKILDLAAVAITGDYNDLLNIPKRYNTPVVLDGTGEIIAWDYSQSDTAVVTLTADKAISISNPYNGCIACIQCYGAQLDFSDETLYRKSATFDYIEPLEAEHIMYTLIYNAGKWDVTAMVYAGGEASA